MRNDRITRLMDRIDWWVYRKRLWWKFLRDSDRQLNRRVDVEQVLLEVAHGKRQMLTQQDCYELAMYLGTPNRGFPLLEASRIRRESGNNVKR